jgi:hypothetical protein
MQHRHVEAMRSAWGKFCSATSYPNTARRLAFV